VFIEAFKPLLVRLPERDVRLLPGRPTNLAPKYARQLVRMGKARLVISKEADWLTLWRYVADLSDGLPPTDPRLSRVLSAITHCDMAFMQGSKAAFLDAVHLVAEAMGQEALQ